MKITITGSLGHISKPLAKSLIQQGHDLTIISSSPIRKKEIEAMGATPAIGSINDLHFLQSAFQGADLVYCMEPPPNFFDENLDNEAFHIQIAQNYAQAIEMAKVKKLIHLSSIGAHRPDGTGMLCYHYQVEQVLDALPSDVSITFMRPVGFYYNLLSFIPAIKATGAIFANYGGDQKEPWVSPMDIAAAISQEIKRATTGRKIRYVASDEISGNEIARILGAAIDMAELKWQRISDAQQLKKMLDIGFNPAIAKGLVEMNASRGNGVLYEDYYQKQPALGHVKMTDFAKEFAAAFAGQK